jgi:YVTN family beta-propeller protein
MKWLAFFVVLIAAVLLWGSPQPKDVATANGTVPPPQQKILVPIVYKPELTPTPTSTNTATPTTTPTSLPTIATVRVGSAPNWVGVNPATNRVYVTNPKSSTVSVIDVTNKTVVATVPVGSNPHAIGVNPTTNRVYVANDNDSTVSVFADGP